MAVKQVKIWVHIQPHASRNEVVGFSDNVLRMKITAPPVEGKANQELIKYISKLFDIRKSDISIDKGLTGRNKIVIISGINSEEFQATIQSIINA
jgi:uncharacterized protein